MVVGWERWALTLYRELKNQNDKNSRVVGSKVGAYQDHSRHDSDVSLECDGHTHD